jgi:dienelactone hydrolase
MAAVGSEVNAAITTLRTKEFVYRAWAKKYWGPAAAAGLETLFAKITVVEDAVHAFNDSEQLEEKKRALAAALQDARAEVIAWLSENDA